MVIISYSNKFVEKNEAIYDYAVNNFISRLLSYMIDSKYRRVVTLSKWIKEQITKPSQNVIDTLKKIPTKSSYDSQAIEVLKYVQRELHYVSDSVKWDMNEYWQTAEETANYSTADCEDGSILAYVLCRLKGIPANRLYIFVGNVWDPIKKRENGHCWLGYKPKNYPLNFVFLDWCYYYTSKNTSNRSLFEVIDKEIHEYARHYAGGYTSQPSNYHDIWFVFNEKKSFQRLKPVWS